VADKVHKKKNVVLEGYLFGSHVFQRTISTPIGFYCTGFSLYAYEPNMIQGLFLAILQLYSGENFFYY
jgi:hypothetical protein